MIVDAASAAMRATLARRTRGPDMTADAARSETVLDLRGLNCPLPVLRAKKALRTIPVGGVLVLECTDPLTAIDIPNLLRQTGDVLESRAETGGILSFRIRKK